MGSLRADRRAAVGSRAGWHPAAHRVWRLDWHSANPSTSLPRKIEHELAAGYQRIKIKVKPGWDLKAAEMVRERFGAVR